MLGVRDVTDSGMLLEEQIGGRNNRTKGREKKENSEHKYVSVSSLHFNCCPCFPAELRTPIAMQS